MYGWSGRTAVVAGQPLAPAASSGSVVSPNGTLSPARSPRNASYDIDVRLEPATRTLTGRETITWRNTTDKATNELQFHTYWNAWRNTRSTFLREQALVRPRTYDDDAFAAVTVTALSVRTAANAGGNAAATDLTSRIAFIAPDDGNSDDATVMRVPLPGDVSPGETIVIDVAWTARVPRPFARTGVIGQFYFLAQWFPKLGVFDERGWNCHQFHANTEFFADFGVYTVKMTVPGGWTVGATGVQRRQVDNGNGTTTHEYYQEDVHDFAWTTSPALVERVADYTPGEPESAAGARPVRIRVLMQPEHLAQAQRHIDATRTALRYYTQWAGPYPYDQLTVIDPAYQSEADGMEYPTLITAGTPWLVSSAVTLFTPEEVVIHEAGHQFFYGIVATNEFEDAWMDEGINTYVTARALVQDYPQTYYERRFFGGSLPWTYADVPVSRETFWNRYNGYRRAPKSDTPATPAFRYSVANGRTITYNKTALWMHTLERHLGWPVMQRVLQTYFTRWQFRHPRPDDFFAIVNEVSGHDMTWFFDQVHRSSNAFDYAVDTLRSTRDGDGYRTEVIVSRLGEATFPVDVVVTFAAGEPIKERWDGQERFHHYTFTRPVRAVSAVVDPDRVLLLDSNFTNNSRTLQSEAGPVATAWSLKWLVWLQDSLLTWAFFA